jgi:hypothetical protein
MAIGWDCLLVGLLSLTSCTDVVRNDAKQEVQLTVNPPVELVRNAFNGDTSFKPVATYTWVGVEQPAFMAVFAKSEGDYHAAAAEIGALFARYNPGTREWAVVSETKSIKSAGQWGEPPEPTFIKLGRDRFGFILKDTGSGQGYVEGQYSIYGVVGSNVIEMLTVPAVSSNMGAVVDDALGYEVNVVLFQTIDDQKPLYDISAKATATGRFDKAFDGRYRELFGPGNTLSYTFRDGIFVKQ